MTKKFLILNVKLNLILQGLNLLHIILYCDEYNLAKNNDDNYILCVTEILSGNSINLHFKHYNKFQFIKSYNRGMTLTKKIIKQISEKIPFSHLSVNLLLDYSGFINLENKLK